MEAVYGPELAFAHDAGFTAVAEAAARELVDLRAGRLVDLGCGGGTFCEAMADRGWSVTGFDVSPDMIALANKRRVAGASFHVADVAQCDIPPADVVTAIGEVLCYACADDAALTLLFQRVRAALPVGGTFLFDLATTGRASEQTHAEAAGKGWRVVATAEEEDGWLTRTIDTWRMTDGVERHAREVHRLRLFDVDDVMAMLAEAGLAAEHLAAYDDYAFQEGWDAFRATAV